MMNPRSLPSVPPQIKQHVLKENLFNFLLQVKFTFAPSVHPLYLIHTSAPYCSATYCFYFYDLYCDFFGNLNLFANKFLLNVGGPLMEGVAWRRMELGVWWGQSQGRLPRTIKGSRWGVWKLQGCTDWESRPGKPLREPVFKFILGKGMSYLRTKERICQLKGKCAKVQGVKVRKTQNILHNNQIIYLCRFLHSLLPS